MPGIDRDWWVVLRGGGRTSSPSGWVWPADRGRRDRRYYVRPDHRGLGLAAAVLGLHRGPRPGVARAVARAAGQRPRGLVSRTPTRWRVWTLDARGFVRRLAANTSRWRSTSPRSRRRRRGRRGSTPASPARGATSGGSRRPRSRRSPSITLYRAAAALRGMEAPLPPRSQPEACAMLDRCGGWPGTGDELAGYVDTGRSVDRRDAVIADLRGVGRAGARGRGLGRLRCLGGGVHRALRDRRLTACACVFDVDAQNVHQRRACLRGRRRMRVSRRFDSDGEAAGVTRPAAGLRRPPSQAIRRREREKGRGG